MSEEEIHRLGQSLLDLAGSLMVHVGDDQAGRIRERVAAIVEAALDVKVIPRTLIDMTQDESRRAMERVAALKPSPEPFVLWIERRDKGKAGRVAGSDLPDSATLAYSDSSLTNAITLGHFRHARDAVSSRQPRPEVAPSQSSVSGNLPTA